MVKQYLLKQLNKRGYELVNLKKKKYPSDFDKLHKSIIQLVEPYTMTTPERLFGVIEAARYIEKYKIEGDIVECGVWKGGSMLAIAETLALTGNTSRKLYLYDTYEGMPEPGDIDVSFDNTLAKELLQKETDKEKNLVWAYSTLTSVKKTMSLSAYDQSKMNFIQGKVEETIPVIIPDKIALLRLDTDWYESTKHELQHLFPRLVTGGVLIIDDYGYWQGARKAVDEYFESSNIKILLNRMDDTGRIAIKQPADENR